MKVQKHFTDPPAFFISSQAAFAVPPVANKSSTKATLHALKLDLISNIDKYANAYSFVEREVANTEKENLKARVENQKELIQSDIGFRKRTGGRFISAINNDDPGRFAENKSEFLQFIVKQF